MKTTDFRVRDVLELTQVTRRGVVDVVEFRTAIVTEVRADSVCFIGHKVDERLETGSGAFRPEDVGAKPYGFTVAVRVIGRGRLPLDGHRSPRPGDRGYDLMC